MLNSTWLWIGTIFSGILICTLTYLSPENRFDLASGLTAAGIVLFIFFTSKKVVTFLLSSIENKNKWAFCLLFLGGLLAVIIDWPGLVSIDDIYLLNSIAQHQISGWHSLPYSLIVSALILISGKTFFTWIFNYTLYTCLLLSILNRKWHLSTPLFLTLIVILASPYMSGLVFFQNRDSVYSLVFIYFITSLYEIYENPQKRTTGDFLSVCFVAWLLGTLRQEGILLFLASPFLILSSFSSTKKVKYGFLILVIGLTSMKLFSLVLDFDSMDYAYKSTAFINPLNSIIHERKINYFSEEDLKKIDAVINVKLLEEMYDPYDIAPFHAGGLRRDIDPKKFSDFEFTSLKLITENWNIYLENRWRIFKRMFNFEQFNLLYWDALRGEDLAKFKTITEKYNLQSKPPQYNPVQRLFHTYLQTLTADLPVFLHFLFASSLLPLVFLFFLGAQYKKFPMIAQLSVLLLARTTIVVMAAPAAYFKYISSTWIGGWILLYLFLNSRQFKLKITSEKSNF